MLPKQSLLLLKLGSSMGLGMAPEPHPDVEGVKKRFPMTNLTIPNNFFLKKYAPKTVPDVADAGDPHGGEDGLPELRPEGPDQKCPHATLISMKN